MHIVRIPKRNGKFRTIYAPNPEEKEAYRKLLPVLLQIAYQICDTKVVHGFMPGRSPITNALCHLNKEYTLCMDLQDFFDTVTWKQLHKLLPEALLDAVMYDGAARQGLPTSPIVANIAASKLDYDILEWIPEEVTYSRYADDLTFSFDDKEVINVLKKTIPKLVESHRFVVNVKKTRVQCSKAGRRIITGVAVDGDTIYPTRRTKRKHRAAKHQRHAGSAAGLKEWMKLIPPKLYHTDMLTEFGKMQKLLGMINHNKHKHDDHFGKSARSINLYG